MCLRALERPVALTTGMKGWEGWRQSIGALGSSQCQRLAPNSILPAPSDLPSFLSELERMIKGWHLNAAAVINGVSL